MNTTVLTPEKELYKGRALSVKVPGAQGQFEILKGHAPIVSSLDTGEILIKEAGGNTIKFEIKGGFVEVLRNEVSLLVHQI